MKKTFLSDLLRRLLLMWLLAVLVEYLLLPPNLQVLSTLAGLRQMSLLRIVLITCVGALALQQISHVTDSRKAERWSIVAVFFALAVISLIRSFSFSYLLFCGVALLIFLLYARFGWNREGLPERTAAQEGNVFLWLTVAASGMFFCLISAWSLGRIWSFSTPTYDFGIFSQMFYSMKQTGIPETTLERDGLLSHFYVHMSPIYYLMLPFYCLAPYPATLQVLQAAVMTSSVIPLWQLGKRHGLPVGQRSLLCLLLLTYPAFAGGAGYDLHENCFLTPLILWLMYGIDCKKLWFSGLCTAALLSVKEDAAVYAAVIALYVIVKALLGNRREDRKILYFGVGMLFAALLWFFVVTGFLNEHGDGVMTYRYSNFLFDGGNSLLTVVKAVILNPMKVLYECADREKLSYIALTMLPLLGLPLLTRRYDRYILLIPYVLVNLMSDYQYQHHIFFQYQFGSLACLFYLVTVNLADMKKLRILPLACAVVISIGCFCRQILPEAVAYPAQSVRYYGYYQQLRDTLSLIPDGVPVAASTFYTTGLSQREILYDIRYASQDHILSTEYIALDVDSAGDYSSFSFGDKTGYDALISLLRSNGYRVFAEIPEELVIYHRAAE